MKYGKRVEDCWRIWTQWINVSTKADLLYKARTFSAKKRTLPPEVVRLSHFVIRHLHCPSPLHCIPQTGKKSHPRERTLFGFNSWANSGSVLLRIPTHTIVARQNKFGYRLVYQYPHTSFRPTKHRRHIIQPGWGV